MAEITVRAIDSALAMEEVQKRLGDDALIISTQRIDGQIEITATDEQVEKAEKEVKTAIYGKSDTNIIGGPRVAGGMSLPAEAIIQEVMEVLNPGKGA